MQEIFKGHVTDQVLCTIIAEMGNPFSALNSQDIVDQLVIETMRNIERVDRSSTNFLLLKDYVYNKSD